jgi:uncharacterized membrane protein
MRYAIMALAIGGIAVLCFALARRFDAPVRPIDLVHVNWNSAYVNQSPDAEVDGVPLAALGILGYALLIALVLLRQKVLTVYWSGILLFYGLYLTNIEARILYVWCEYWVASLILIVLIAFLAIGDLIW